MSGAVTHLQRNTQGGVMWNVRRSSELNLSVADEIIGEVNPMVLKDPPRQEPPLCVKCGAEASFGGAIGRLGDEPEMRIYQCKSCGHLAFYQFD